MSKTALITGAAGFVGRALVPKLKAAGYDVAELDTKIEQQTQFQRFEFLAWLQSGWPAQAPCFDAVVHLAANIPDVSERMKPSIERFRDIELDLAMAGYIQARPPRECFIYPSSCAVDNPRDPYAWVKLCGERFCETLWERKIPTVILRPFSGYGPDQSESYPFRAILERALRHENPLVVWGSGEQVRDFIHIEDLADAFVWAIKGAPRRVPIEVGTGIGTSMIDLARMIAEAVGYKAIVCGNSAMPESSPRRVAKTELAETFGWKAKISLREGIERAVAERRAEVRS